MATFHTNSSPCYFINHPAVDDLLDLLLEYRNLSHLILPDLPPDHEILLQDLIRRAEILLRAFDILT